MVFVGSVCGNLGVSLFVFVVVVVVCFFNDTGTTEIYTFPYTTLFRSVEGLVLGLVGGLIAFLLQWGLYSLIVSKIMSTMAAGIITVLPFASVSLPLLLVFLGVGVLVGVFGGLTAIRNYLKV